MDRTFEIFDHLEANGLTVHFPNKHQGECENPYVVVKDMGKFSTNGVTGRGLIHLLLYVPESNYEATVSLVNQVKGVMIGLTTVRPTGLETPIIHEDVIKAYSTSIEYKFNKRV